MTEINRDNFDEIVKKRVPGEYVGLPETEYKAPRPMSDDGRALVAKARNWYYFSVILNGSISLMNLAFFVFLGWHWYSLAAAIFSGSIALWFAKKLDNDPNLQYDEE